MKRFVDRLEGGYRVVRIRRIRRYVYFILALITISFALMVMVANGGSLRPFYLPLDIVIGVILVMAVVWLVLAFIFRNLRIRYATRGSQKFLMAKNSMGRGLMLIVVCAIVGSLVVMPFFHSLTEDQLSSDQTQSVSLGLEKEVNFWNMDNLALTRTREVKLVVENHDVNVCFLEGDYVNGSACDDTDVVLASGSKTYSLPQTEYRMFSIVLNNSSPTPSQVRLRARSGISENILAIVPLTMFIIVILNVVWIAFLHPVRRKFATASIYSRDYVEEVTSDVEVYARRLPAKGRAPSKAAPRPAEVSEAVPSAQAQVEAEVPLIEEIAKPPPPPPEMEIPPPPDLVDVPYLFEQAKDRISSGEFEEAARFYDDILEREPDNIAAMIGKGTALISLEREDETILCMNQVLEADPKNKAALLWMAKIFESKQNWEESLKWHDRYLGVYPGDENQWIKHGDVLVNVGREDIAIESYRNALKINPQNEEAIQKLEKLKISVKELMTQALSRSTLGDYLGALEIFDRVLRIEPGNTRALLGKGVAYRRLNKITSGIECLNLVLETDPENQAALLNKGGLLEGQERWEEALYCYNRLVEMNPKDEEAWVKKGDVHLELGMKEEALASYREALEVNPQNQDVAQRYSALEGEVKEVLEEKKVIEQLSKIRGVSAKRAALLYDAGFRTIDDLNQASINRLKSIKGISRKTARMILESVRAEAQDFNRKLNEIPGVGPSLAKAIVEEGFSSIDQIMSSSPKELSKVKGISKKKAEKIIEFLSQ
ncbi:MAG: helix-hairpin-helix domain-containing protein [Thermoplasmata archaeon]